AADDLLHPFVALAVRKAHLQPVGLAGALWDLGFGESVRRRHMGSPACKRRRTLGQAGSRSAAFQVAETGLVVAEGVRGDSEHVRDAFQVMVHPAEPLPGLPNGVTQVPSHGLDVL